LNGNCVLSTEWLYVVYCNGDISVFKEEVIFEFVHTTS